MTCTANAIKIANPLSAARMMYVLVLRLTATIAPSLRHPWLRCVDEGEATSGSAADQSRGDD